MSVAEIEPYTDAELAAGGDLDAARLLATLLDVVTERDAALSTLAEFGNLMRDPQGNLFSTTHIEAWLAGHQAGAESKRAKP